MPKEAVFTVRREVEAEQLPKYDREMSDTDDQTPNATTIAAMEDARSGGGKTMTLEQYNAEVKALVAGEK
jgi:hypothetical protein